MSLNAALKETLGLDGLEYRHDLGKDALFREALANDRGRIRADGPDDEPKAYETALGLEGRERFETNRASSRQARGPTDGVGGAGRGDREAVRRVVRRRRRFETSETESFSEFRRARRRVRSGTRSARRRRARARPLESAREGHRVRGGDGPSRRRGDSRTRRRARARREPKTRGGGGERRERRRARRVARRKIIFFRAARSDG